VKILEEKKRPDLVTATGAGTILGWTRARVNIYIRRDRFPVPYGTLNEGIKGMTQPKVWLRSDIEAFKADRERGEARKE
jgi:hypothetical protein